MQVNSVCQVQDGNWILMFFLHPASSCFLNAVSEWTDVCEVVNISYARSGQTIIVSLTCKCSVSCTNRHNLFTFSVDVMKVDCCNCTSSTSALHGCNLEMAPYSKSRGNMTLSDALSDTILILLGPKHCKKTMYSRTSICLKLKDTQLLPGCSLLAWIQWMVSDWKINFKMLSEKEINKESTSFYCCKFSQGKFHSIVW